MLRTINVPARKALFRFQTQLLFSLGIAFEIRLSEAERWGCRGGGKARARGESGPSLFSIELAGRYKGVKLQIVAIDKFALESHVVSVAQTAETLYVNRTSAVRKRYGKCLP